MLEAFGTANFRSFKDRVDLILVPASITGHENTNIITVHKHNKLLKSSVIYGANASGKSNIVRALNFMQYFVLNSARPELAASPVLVERFRLNTETDNKPSTFEVSFTTNNTQYRYGFSVTTDKIHEEWLYSTPISTEVPLFTRKFQKFDISYRFVKEAKKIYQDATRPNSLFLSVLAGFNGEIATQIFQWFSKLIITSGVDDGAYLNFALKHLRDSEEDRKNITKLLKLIDVGIEALSVEAQPATPDNFPQGTPEAIKKLILDQGKVVHTNIKTTHIKYDKNIPLETREIFDLVMNESGGTTKFIFLTTVIFEALRNGSPLIVDEIEARLHPFITRLIIEIFHTKATNPKDAQLIITTHDTKLLDKNIFRRDQIWFIEKDNFGASNLVSLDEFKERKGALYEKEYLQGEYGGIPYIKTDLETVVEEGFNPVYEETKE